MPETNQLEFIGRWQLISITDNGRVIPTETLPQVLVVMNESHHTVYFGDQIVAHEIPFQIDLNTFPYQTTDFLPDGNQIKGITQVDGDTLTSCVSAAGAARPMKFESNPGSHQILRVFKRLA